MMPRIWEKFLELADGESPISIGMGTSTKCTSCVSAGNYALLKGRQYNKSRFGRNHRELERI